MATNGFKIIPSRCVNHFIIVRVNLDISIGGNGLACGLKVLERNTMVVILKFIKLF
jgi:hypothetical protein